MRFRLRQFSISQSFVNEKNIPVVLNPAPAAEVPMDIIDKVTYVTPNEHEAVLIFGDELSTEKSFEEVSGEACDYTGIPRSVYMPEKWRSADSTCKKGECVDTTGAGDTLNGAFSVRIAAGDDMKSALTYANVAASLSTEKFGAQTGMPTAEED